MKIQGCSALVTGASAGIGWEFGQQLAAGGAKTLVVIARRSERLETLRGEIARKHPDVQVHTKTVDVAERTEIHSLVQWLERENIAIDLLINNAGLGDVGFFAGGDPAKIDSMIQVNIAALTTLTRLLLPQMIARQRGAILNVSSSASFLPMAGFAVYAATKAYVTSFSEALRTELRGSGISVCALCPGPVHTEFTQVAQRSGGGEMTSPEFTHVPVEQVVRAGIAAIESDKPLVIPGVVMKLGMLFVRLLPRPVLRLASRLTARRAFDRDLIYSRT